MILWWMFTEPVSFQPVWPTDGSCIIDSAYRSGSLLIPDQFSVSCVCFIICESEHSVGKRRTCDPGVQQLHCLTAVELGTGPRVPSLFFCWAQTFHYKFCATCSPPLRSSPRSSRKASCWPESMSWAGCSLRASCSISLPVSIESSSQLTLLCLRDMKPLFLPHCHVLVASFQLRRFMTLTSLFSNEQLSEKHANIT